jgi:hypothetical protein
MRPRSWLRVVPQPLLDNYALRLSDVVVVSFPKAGRTWLRMLMGQAIARHFAMMDRPVEDILSVTPLGRDRKDVPRVLFTHDGNPQGSTPEEIRGRSRAAYRHTRVIFLVRDPRDVIVSLYFQRSRRVGLQNQTPVDEPIASFVRQRRGGLESVVEFYRVWLEQRSRAQEFLLIRYEDLHRDPHAELRRVMEFIGVADVATETLGAAVAESRFDSMRKLEASGAIAAEALTPGAAGDVDSYKTRRGEVGGYRDYLTELDQEWAAGLVSKLPAELGYS